MTQLKWTERKFDFGFRKEYLPFLIERLKATTPRIKELVKNVSEVQLFEQVNKQWSIKEHIGHLIDLEELHEERIDQFAKGLTTLRAADMNNKKTYDANHNQKKITDLIKEFRKVRNKFILRLANFDENKLEHKALHPRLQKEINVVDLAYFVGEHDNHHLTLVSQLIKRANER